MRDKNAKEEFIEHVAGREVKCVAIEYESYFLNAPRKKIALPTNFTAEDWESFLVQMDFTYDSGYGCQELEGTIWYQDGTWSSRGEYDGSEWWEHNVYPAIPAELRGAS